MNTQTASAKKSATQNPVVDALNLLLADSYSLMAMSHQAHWNVEGQSFFALHRAFQEHYENLFTAIDEIAERVRALDAYALGGLRAYHQESGLEEFPTGSVSAKDYVAGLVIGHEKALSDAVSLRDSAGESKDPETEDLAIARITWHQKTLWMLKSYLKSA